MFKVYRVNRSLYLIKHKFNNRINNFFRHMTLYLVLIRFADASARTRHHKVVQRRKAFKSDILFPFQLCLTNLEILHGHLVISLTLQDKQLYCKYLSILCRLITPVNLANTQQECPVTLKQGYLNLTKDLLL